MIKKQLSFYISEKNDKDAEKMIKNDVSFGSFPRLVSIVDYGTIKVAQSTKKATISIRKKKNKSSGDRRKIKVEKLAEKQEEK